MSNTKNWPLWEVFVRSKNGLEHRHFGSLHAADAEMALENARDVYTRRNEGVSIWVVESKHIKASNMCAIGYLDPIGEFAQVGIVPDPDPNGNYSYFTSKSFKLGTATY